MTVELEIEPATETDVEWGHKLMAGQQHRDLVTRLYEGLKLLFRDRSDRLVMSEVSTYDATGTMTIPDVAVVFGRPQANVRSYRVGSDAPAPEVVIEVVSPNDTDDANGNKLDAHRKLGTKELWFLHLRTGVEARFRAHRRGFRAGNRRRLYQTRGKYVPV